MLSTNDVLDRLVERLKVLLKPTFAPKDEGYGLFDVDPGTAVTQGRLQRGDTLVLVGYGTDEASTRTGATQRALSVISITVSLMIPLEGDGTLQELAIRRLNDAMDRVVMFLPGHPSEGTPYWYTLPAVDFRGVQVGEPVPIIDFLGQYVGRSIPVQISIQRL